MLVSREIVQWGGVYGTLYYMIIFFYKSKTVLIKSLNNLRNEVMKWYVIPFLWYAFMCIKISLKGHNRKLSLKISSLIHLTTGITQAKKNKENNRKETIWTILGLVIRMNLLEEKTKAVKSWQALLFQV